MVILMLDKQLTDAETSADAPLGRGEKPSLGGDNPEHRAEGGLCLNTLPDDASLSQVIARLNDLLIAMHFVYAGGVVDRDTLSMVNAKTKLMRGTYKKPTRLAAEPEPKFGCHESEQRAVVFVRSYLKEMAWRPGERYPNAGNILNAVMAAGLTDRQGRMYDQQKIRQLAKMGGYQGKFD